ncbi:MAG: YybH family protein [Saprospiraceae bacterium]
MKNFLFNLFAFCVFALLAQTLQAQTISAADQKGIEACYTDFMSAFEKMDASGIEALLTEDAEQITPEGNLTRGRANVVANIKGYMEFLKSQPKPDKYETKNLGTQNRYLAPDVILSTYTEENTINFGNQTKVEKITTAVVLKKSNGKWLADLITLTPVVPMPDMGK